ncbi:MAG: hypothetical protein FJZ90_06810, partial [Chloroflexi bacterium]|nr:hypothetical protein [Chloroflexota bacterium]
MRGRSFFLQILSDALVRSLVERLGLCWANVVYAAGGNFQVLAPADSADEILAWEAEVNSTLLTHFRGDLYLTLAAQPCAAGELRAPGFSQVRERLGAQVAQAKHHAFRDLLRAGERGALFEPQGQGGLESCNVCQRDPDPGEAFTDDKCPLCASLEKLARDIAHDDLWMIVDRASPSGETWQEVLHAVSGFRYRFFGPRRPQAGRDERVYRVNAVEMAGPNWGYRFIANVTPRIRASDRSWFLQHYPEEPAPDVDDVKDFEFL